MGQPLQGIQIRMVASYGLYEEDFETGFPEWRIYTFSKVGYTDANGNVLLEGFVNVTAYYPWKYKFYDLKVLMESPNYSIVSHSGDYSQLSHTSAYFTIGEDEDGNGVYDEWEYELAQKFCPVLKLHSGDHGVKPVPVEILDRNGDGILNGEDVYYRIINLALYDLGELPANNIWARSRYLDTFYPYDDAGNEKELIEICIFDFDRDGIGDTKADTYFIIPHFEFGKIGGTSPSVWYSEFDQKLSEHSDDSRYIKGTTYVYFNKISDNNLEIQYWFFYPFNAAANRHEGDWERVYIYVNSGDPEIAQIIKVRYYHHENFSEYQTDKLQFVNNTHVKVFVGGYTYVNFPEIFEGNGTHASYPWPGKWKTKSLNTNDNVDGKGIEINFDAFRNLVIIPRYEYIINRNLIEEPFINFQGYDLSWVRFEGFWGHIVSEPSYLASQKIIVDILGNLFENISEWTGFYDFEYNGIGNIAPKGPFKR